MRLHKVTMANVGPYVGLVEIDFDAMGDAFLICGKTGSGKTTIFDAVSYALYGSARNARDIVSHYAAADDDVFVELDFDAGGDRWRVVRRPARTVAKKRGAGTTERPAEVALWRRGPSGWLDASDKATEVDAAIERAIGLSWKEFTKIVLLPQGEFQKFLEMDTGERTAILEKLFPVDIHAAVIKLAWDKSREAEARAKGLDERLISMEAEFGEAPEAALAAMAAELEEARGKERAATAALDAAKAVAQAAAQAAKAYDELDAALAEGAVLESTAAEARSLAARLSRGESAVMAMPAVEAARRLRAERADAAAAQASASVESASLEARAGEMGRSALRLTELSSSLEAMIRESERLSGRAEAWARLREATGRLSAAEIMAGEAEAKAAAAEAKLAAATEALAAIESKAADGDALLAARSAASLESEAARDGLRRSVEAARVAAEIGALNYRAAAESERVRLALLLVDETADTASRLEAAAEALRDELAAAHLAAHLSAGSPCPVCGSLDHPALAAGTPGTADKQTAGDRALVALDDDEARASGTQGDIKKLAAARKAAQEAQNAVAGIGAGLAEIRTTLAQRQAAAAEYDGLPSVDAATEAARLAGSRLASAEAAIASEASRDKSARLARAEVDRQRKTLDDAKSAGTQAAAERSAAAAAVSEARESAGGADPGPEIAALARAKALAGAEKLRLEAETAAWEKARLGAAAMSLEAGKRLERSVAASERAEADALKSLSDAGFDGEESWDAAAMAAIDLADAKRASAARADAESRSGARLAAARRAVAGIERPDAAATETALAAAQAGYAAARAAVDDATRRERERASALQGLAALKAERAALRVRGDGLVAMSKLLNGETDGRHLSFKNFVLASYFGTVVERASMRLRDMTDARYDMRVAEGKASGRGRVGLDLEVLDAFTGIARPASSLSGGEKFLASISLALGLSDVIVERSGGVALDSIFIDEGFGSLDDETLDRAMAALDRIRGERVIGIVSHVAELRSRMPARIEVIKSSESSAGSTIRVVS